MREWPDCPLTIRTRRGRETLVYEFSAMPNPGDKHYFRGQKRETSHWMWRGALSGTGHPMGYLFNEAERSSISRVVLEWWLGRPLLPGMCALHKCQVTGCVSPYPGHLVEGPARLGQGQVKVVERLTETEARRERRRRAAENAVRIKQCHIDGDNCGVKGCVKCRLIAPDPSKTYGTAEDEKSVPSGQVPKFTDAEQANNMLWGNVYQDWEESGRTDDEVVKAAWDAGIPSQEFRRQYGLPFGLPIVWKGVTYYGR